MLPPVGHPRRIVERLKEHRLQIPKSVREFLAASQMSCETHCVECTGYLHVPIKYYAIFHVLNYISCMQNFYIMIVSQLPANCLYSSYLKTFFCQCHLCLCCTVSSTGVVCLVPDRSISSSCASSGVDASPSKSIQSVNAS